MPCTSPLLTKVVGIAACRPYSAFIKQHAPSQDPAGIEDEQDAARMKGLRKNLHCYCGLGRDQQATGFVQERREEKICSAIVDGDGYQRTAGFVHERRILGDLYKNEGKKKSSAFF